MIIWVSLIIGGIALILAGVFLPIDKSGSWAKRLLLVIGIILVVIGYIIYPK